MSEKKELNNEELKKVSGGEVDESKGLLNSKVAGPIEETTNPNNSDNDTFYGPAQ